MSRAAFKTASTLGTSAVMNCAAASSSVFSGKGACGFRNSTSLGFSASSDFSGPASWSVTASASNGKATSMLRGASCLAASSKRLAKGSKPKDFATWARVCLLALKGAHKASMSSRLSACSKLSPRSGVRCFPRCRARATLARFVSRSLTRFSSRSTRRRFSSFMEPVCSFRYRAMKGSVLPSWKRRTAPATCPFSKPSWAAIQPASSFRICD
mmetsp:Transcript_33772/g.80989  ORF Transcript_33772/g.80989 Transcript_33772/m.80989 type:complete len:213 (-) Transcript_33772:560-1198(-)